jgi:hypothetical protein
MFTALNKRAFASKIKTRSRIASKPHILMQGTKAAAITAPADGNVHKPAR